MKKISCLLLLLLPSLLFAVNQKVRITGKIKGMGTNQVVIVNGDRQRIASCVSEGDKFSLEFDYDLDKNARVLLYLPHLDPSDMVQPENSYGFMLDTEVKLSGHIKDVKVLNFKAISLVNDQYNQAKFGTPSTKERLNLEAKAKKSWEEYGKYINPTDNPEDSRSSNTDTLAKALFEKYVKITDVISKVNYKCIVEASEMLTSEMNKGLNAFLYMTCNGLNYESLKPIMNNFRKNYTDAQMESDFYLNELLKTYKLKAVRNAGEPLYDFDFVDLKGNVVKLNDFKGKYLYVNIYDTGFEPSLVELKKIQELEANYKDKNIVFLNLNVNKDREAWKKFCESNQITSHININDQRSFFGVYKVEDLPRGILIDDKGLIHTFKVGTLFGDNDPKTQANLNNGKTIDVILKELFH